MVAIAEVLEWLLTLEALSLLSWPLARRALSGAADGGWAASRVLGLLLLSLAIGIASTLPTVPFERTTLMFIAVLGGGALWLAFGRRRYPPRPGTPARGALVGEAVFLGTFALALGLRVLFPSADNNERPMDFAFLDAFVRGNTLAPTDPWFAGQPIAYYTFGYVNWATLTRLSGVPIEVAYNLAIASVFATSVALVWATVASVGRRRFADGFLAAATLGLLGNLRTLVDVLITFGVGTQEWWSHWATSVALVTPDPGWTFWLQAARVIPNSTPDGVTEFPFFSLIVADLHPHFMAMPLNLLALAIALAAWRGGPLPLLLPLGAAAVAALAATNTWNAPAAVAVIVLGLASRLLVNGALHRTSIRLAAVLAGFALLSVLLAAPLLRGVQPPPLSLALTPRDARLWPGTFVVLFLPYVLALLAVLVAHAAPSRLWLLALAGCAAVGVLSEVLANAAVAVLLSALACALGVLAWRALRASDATRSGLLIICAAGAGLVVLPNLLFVDDYFGSPMNTIFKSHFQALVFFAVGLPPLLSMLPRPAPRGGERLLLWLRKGAVYAGLLTLVYVPLGVFTRAALSPPGGTLDALAFLHLRAPDDGAAIDWLRSEAPAGSVIVEAAQSEDPVGVWRVDVGRFSAFSGQPTVLGWREHEQQWRGRLPAIDRRLADVDSVYAGSFDAAADALATYAVRYVVVGQTEHARYGEEVDARFRGWLEPAFESGQTTVYRVPEQLSARAEAAGQ